MLKSVRVSVRLREREREKEGRRGRRRRKERARARTSEIWKWCVFWCVDVGSFCVSIRIKSNPLRRWTNKKRSTMKKSNELWTNWNVVHFNCFEIELRLRIQFRNAFTHISVCNQFYNAHYKLYVVLHFLVIFDDEWRIQESLKRNRDGKKNKKTRLNHMFSRAFDVNGIAITTRARECRRKNEKSVCKLKKNKTTTTTRKNKENIGLKTVRLERMLNMSTAEIPWMPGFRHIKCA